MLLSTLITDSITRAACKKQRECLALPPETLVQGNLQCDLDLGSFSKHLGDSEGQPDPWASGCPSSLPDPGHDSS